MHHIVFLVLYYFFANLQSAFGFIFVSFSHFFCALVPYSNTMPRKTRANRVPSTPAVSPSRVQLFRNECAREVYEKLNSKRKIWNERSVILDKVDPAIRVNLESRGWLSLLKIDHPPPTALIREFFSNFSCHIYDSNTVVRSWIRGEEFTITPRVVAEALGVPIGSIPMMSHLLLMRSCHTSLDHLSSGVLILGSRLLRFLRPHICFLELRVILCGPFLISTPSL